MGVVETKQSYKTKAIIEIFLWHSKIKRYDKYTCEEIQKLPDELQCEVMDKISFEGRFNMPFSLFEDSGVVTIDKLQTSLLLLSRDEQGSRIDLFHSLTTDPERLISYFRWKYTLIYSKIPKYLLSINLLDKSACESYLQRKSHKIFEISNHRYIQYTTSGYNVLKLTLLKK